MCYVAIKYNFGKRQYIGTALYNFRAKCTGLMELRNSEGMLSSTKIACGYMSKNES